MEPAADSAYRTYEPTYRMKPYDDKKCVRWCRCRMACTRAQTLLA